jgi:Heterokaryon incompatibility protein (HET)
MVYLRLVQNPGWNSQQLSPASTVRTSLIYSDQTVAMRLLDSSTFQFEEFLGTDIPPYAILSHTWSTQEISYDEMLSPGLETRQKVGYLKIQSCCRIAKERGLSYAWVDSCCIDKRSSAELSEAINSMYRYYEEAKVFRLSCRCRSRFY